MPDGNSVRSVTSPLLPKADAMLNMQTDLEAGPLGGDGDSFRLHIESGLRKPPYIVRRSRTAQPKLQLEASVRPQLWD